MKKNVAITIDIVAMFLLILIDQVTKRLAVINLKDQNPIILIDNILQFRYLENRGAAFGMLQNKKLLFVFITIVMLTAIFYALFKLPLTKKYLIWHVFLCFIAAGGIGNMIDRVMHDYVIDFIYFILIDFPIFNFADILVTIGTILLFIDLLFLKKEEDLAFLKLEIHKNDR